MPRPNWKQWIVIWIATWMAAHVWLELRFSDFWHGAYGRWGFHGYLYNAAIYRGSKLAFTIVVIGALLVWHLSGTRKGQVGK